MFWNKQVKHRLLTRFDLFKLNGDQVAVSELFLYMYVDVYKWWRVCGAFQVVVSLGLVVYRALDHTHADDEERLISPDLEALISDMTLSNGNLAGNIHKII